MHLQKLGVTNQHKVSSLLCERFRKKDGQRIP